VGALGRDHAGETLLAALIKDGVDVSAVQRVSAPTGRALIGVSDDGENSIIVVPGANHAISIDDIEKYKSLISSAKVLLCQLEVPLSVVQRAFELAGPSTKRILNPAPAQTLPHSLLGVVDIVTPNEHEVELLGGVSKLQSLGVKTVIVTQGEKGAMVVDETGTRQVDPLKVTPVDTTGAGDAFCGMLAARLALGESMSVALRAAVIAGALATQTEGAVPSLPLWSMVKTKLES
jgi:ribokinase